MILAITTAVVAYAARTSKSEAGSLNRLSQSRPLVARCGRPRVGRTPRAACSQRSQGSRMIDPLVSLAFSVHSSKGAYALLLGSGVSRAAGIPTGWEVVLDLIRKVAKLEGEDC